MDDSGGQRGPRTRILAIAAVGVVVSGVTVGAALLVGDAEFRWGAGPALRLVAAGIMLVISGVCINLLPKAVVRIWRLREGDPQRVSDLVGRVGAMLRRPLRVFWVVVTVAALVGAGIVLRPPPTGPEPGPLVVMTAFPPDPGDARSMLAEQWNRLNPENPIRFDYAPVKSDEQHTRMVNDAKPGGERKADVYVLDIVWMAEFASRGYIRPLDESRLQDRDMGDFVPKVLDTCDHDGARWALPFNSDVGLLFRRTDIAGVGGANTWAGYFGDAARQSAALARSARPGIQVANAAQLAPDDEMLTITALEAIWGAGGRVVGTNGQPALTSDQSEVDFGAADRDGIKALARAARDPDLVLLGEDGGADRASAETAAKVFGEGRALYMRNWAIAREGLTGKVPFEVAALPEAGVLGGQNLAISSATDKPRAAQALIQFLTNPASQQILSEVGGFVPTRQSAFTHSRRPDAQQLQIALNQARLRPITPRYTEFSRVFRQGVSRAITNGGELEPGLARELAEILNGP